MQDSAGWSVPCGNVGLPVHVRAHRPDWRRVRSAGRSGLKQAGPGRLWSGPGQLWLGQGRLWSGPGQISFGSARPSGVMWGPTGPSR